MQGGDRRKQIPRPLSPGACARGESREAIKQQESHKVTQRPIALQPFEMTFWHLPKPLHPVPGLFHPPAFENMP